MDRDDKILNYLQDRMSPADRALFEKAMADDVSLSAEVDVMRSVRSELSEGPVHRDADRVWDRLSENIDAPAQAANDNRQPWRQVLQYAAVAVVAVAAWQFTVVPRLAQDQSGFQAASEQTSGFRLQVKFADSATLGEIADVLRPLDGTITDGPSALGLVLVSFPDKDTQQVALAELAARNDLVELALEQ